MRTYINTQQRVSQWLFYGGLAGLLILVLPRILDMIIPGGFAGRVAYNTEAYLFALVLGLWIQVALPRLPYQSWLRWAIGHGAVWAAIGVALVLSDLPSRVRTLNEAALAVAILIPYVGVRRPLSRWILLVPSVLAGVTVWSVVWAPEGWVIDHAETFGFLALAVLTFDFFDRVLLEPNATVNNGLRWAWYGFMMLEPIVVSMLGTDIRAGGGGLALTLGYLGRIHESFVGVLLLVLILHIAPGYRQRLDARSTAPSLRAGFVAQ